MIRKLRLKFIAILMVLVTIVLCVVFGMVYHFTQSSLETEAVGMLRAVAIGPNRLGRPGEPTPNLKLPHFTLHVGKNGELISSGGEYYDLSDEGLLLELMEKSTEEIGVLKEHNLRYCRTETPVGTVLVFADMSGEITTLRNLVKTSVVIGIFGLLVFFGISVFLSRWAVRPVEEAWRQQKQFVADASHELKTPLTVIMTNVDLLQSEEYDQEEKSRFVQSIATMSGQMRSLVEHLLELTRTERAKSQMIMEPLDLSHLVLDAAISFEGVFVEKGLLLESEVDPDISVWGNGDALRQVVDILLDNAQKYSDDGGQTELRLYRVGQNKCHLRVSNPGQNLSGEDLENIFRRFYRMDKARSRDGSFGLGLPIALNIVEQHKGKIWAESKDGINRFFVELHRRG